MKVWIRWYFFLALPNTQCFKIVVGRPREWMPFQRICLPLIKQINHPFDISILFRFHMLFIEMLLHLFIFISWKQLTIFIRVKAALMMMNLCIFNSASWQQKDHSNFGAPHSSALLKSPCFLQIGESTFEIEGLKIVLQNYVIWSDLWFSSKTWTLC